MPRSVLFRAGLVALLLLGLCCVAARGAFLLLPSTLASVNADRVDFWMGDRCTLISTISLCFLNSRGGASQLMD